MGRIDGWGVTKCWGFLWVRKDLEGFLSSPSRIDPGWMCSSRSWLWGFVSMLVRWRGSYRSIRTNNFTIDSKVSSSIDTKLLSWVDMNALLMDSKRSFTWCYGYRSRDLCRYEVIESTLIDSKHIESTCIDPRRSIRPSSIQRIQLFWLALTSELWPISSWNLTNLMNFSILDSDELLPCITELDCRTTLDCLLKLVDGTVA